jgi:predicted nucleotidyltransferase
MSQRLSALLVQIMDLIRPQSRIEAKKVIEKYASEEPKVLRIDFMNSLLAAYRPAEIVEQLASVNMNSLSIDIVNDRHFIVFGTVDKY